MAEITTNPIADAVAGNDVVTFNGWLATGTSEGSYRLFLEPWFRTWLELTARDILGQLAGENGTSTVWVRSDAKVNKCQSGSAIGFADETDELDDLAAGLYPKK